MNKLIEKFSPSLTRMSFMGVCFLAQTLEVCSQDKMINKTQSCPCQGLHTREPQLQMPRHMPLPLPLLDMCICARIPTLFGTETHLASMSRIANHPNTHTQPQNKETVCILRVSLVSFARFCFRVQITWLPFKRKIAKLLVLCAGVGSQSIGKQIYCVWKRKFPSL